MSPYKAFNHQSDRLYRERESNPHGHYWPVDFHLNLIRSDYVFSMLFSLGGEYIVSTHLEIFLFHLARRYYGRLTPYLHRISPHSHQKFPSECSILHQYYY